MCILTGFIEKHIFLKGRFSQMLLVSNFSYVISIYVFLNMTDSKVFQGLKQGKDYILHIVFFMHRENFGELL